MCGLHQKMLPLLALMAAAARSSPMVGPEPIRCAPCTQEKLNECPAVPADCRQVLREPGCGCCMACALERGSSCGVHTAHCAEGLRCTPRPGEARPLHALTRGLGVCTEELAQEDTEGVSDHSSLQYLLGDTAEPQESFKAKVNAIRNKLVQQVRGQNIFYFTFPSLTCPLCPQGPCHIELHAALEVIASAQQTLGEKFTTFYLPNCDKHGFYKAKQCESSLVGPPTRCWCVSSWNGKVIPGASELPGDAECHQEVTH
ncbi:insulin-like growth factor-binding protein 1 isoform X1 [Nerophis lumbriciformis]|uniref:insulin-like growth factor-binding protein 1 isoform X1 n=1 Tax=Nerophis lumbriciformis TaxID=546530 RepID=UPI002ADF178F|nr:insulin-like growth factor-binding protein 1 isoform X1 [Nerophis lumbriciformis]